MPETSDTRRDYRITERRGHAHEPLLIWCDTTEAEARVELERFRAGSIFEVYLEEAERGTMTYRRLP